MLPLVSVVLPVYNGEMHLEVAIRSILTQSYTNLELIIVIDGSKDRSFEIAKGFVDPRINLQYLEKNRGLVGALNHGIEVSNGKYIARMDQDDISLPTRIEEQVNFLEQNLDVDILGTYFETFGKYNQVKTIPTEDENIKLHLYFESAFCHPSVMFRKETLDKYGLKYNEEFKDVEDYAMWINAANHNLKMANLKSLLLKYRIEGQSTTAQKRDIRKSQFKQIYNCMLSDLFPGLTNDDLDLHYAFNSLYFADTQKSDLGNYSNRLFKALANKGFNSVYLDPIFKNKNHRVFCKLADKEFFISLKFMSQTKSFSWSNFRYLCSAMFKRSFSK